jgi:hypothetical protein
MINDGDGCQHVAVQCSGAASSPPESGISTRIAHRADVLGLLASGRVLLVTHRSPY